MCSAKVKQMDIYSGIYEIEIYKDDYILNNCNSYFNNVSPQIYLNHQIHFSFHHAKKEAPYQGILNLDRSFFSTDL